MLVALVPLPEQHAARTPEALGPLPLGRSVLTVVKVLSSSYVWSQFTRRTTSPHSHTPARAARQPDRHRMAHAPRCSAIRRCRYIVEMYFRHDSRSSVDQFSSVQLFPSYFTVPPRAHPSTGSQSGSATRTPGLTQVPSTRSRGLLNCRK